jgi:HEAT repeat protein
MTVKRVIFALVVVLAVLCVIILARHATEQPEPTYEGKTVSAWALALNIATTRPAADELFRKIGTNAVPALVRMLQTRDPLLARPLRALGRRLPDRLSRGMFRIVDPYDAGRKRAAAAAALRIVGARAQAALPTLQSALRDNETISWHAALTLAELGPPGLAALTNALPAARMPQAGFICYALGSQGVSASNAVPALAATLRSGSPQAAEPAAHALASIGRSALPALENALAHTNLQVRVAVADALGTMGPWARKTTPKLLEMARSDQAPAHRAATNALAKLGVPYEETAQ